MATLLAGTTVKKMANSFSKILAWFNPNLADPEVIFAQLDELITKVPLLYLILLMNSASLAYTHYSLAPRYLTLYIPAVLAIAASYRALKWLSYRNRLFSLEEAKRHINGTVLFAFIMGVGFSAWGFKLYSYGDIAHQAHVAYFMSITVLGVIVCLIHLPIAAISILASVGTAFVIFFIASGQSVFVAISLNFMLVSAVMVLVTVSYFRAFSGVILSRLNLQKDHKEIQRLNAQNEILANEDGLTGLANRRAFFTRLDLLIALHKDSPETERRFVVALIDLDGFKPINDIYGHAAGDNVLVEISRRLSRVLDSNSILARMGGDEFAIAIARPLDEKAIQTLSQNILSALEEPHSTHSGSIQLSGSCGFATYPEAGTETGPLLERADFAMYEAKSNNGGQAVIFSCEHEKLIRRKSLIKQSLRNVVETDAFTLNYQPIVNSNDGSVIGVEALARWQHPSLDGIPPGEFIPIAENMGLISGITAYLFEKAVTDFQYLPDNIYLSFNLSGHDIINSNTINLLLEIVSRRAIPPNRIQFEITETAMIQDLSACAATTANLREKGFKIALDDFGSGYSSLGYIHKLSINVIKIDREFIYGMKAQARNAGIVKTILELATNLGVNCIAEGVETEEQRDALIKLGCIMMQGYLFSKPGAINTLRLTP